ncbi:MAG: flagellar basal body P-ring protein FlgI [Spirochaetales bacterium]|nr:flagellar basal body P-ring protein FlgI [Spirochaetales bacterium]
MISKRVLFLLLFVFLHFQAFSQDEMTVRLKDIAYLQGIRENQLVGFGLITGLQGNGDGSNSALLKNVLSNLLSSFSISIEADDITSRNTAVVMVTADIPAFVRPGDRISVHVSSLGDARSLRNGVLLQTPLKASNGVTYAVAQGQVGGSESQIGPETVSTIPGGAIVEREVLSTYLDNDRVSIILRNPDFTTASRIASLLKSRYPEETVEAIDASLIQISLPEDALEDTVGFISSVEELEVVPDAPARVVVNPRTGIVVVGKNVKIGRVAVTYRGTKVDIGVPRTRSASGEEQHVLSFPDLPTVDELVNLLQTTGLDTDTIIEILKAIEQAGALYGRLLIM